MKFEQFLNLNIKIILFFLLLFSGRSFAQTESVVQGNKPDRYFKFNYDNDFFSATDRYYTQGIYLELVAPVIKKSPLSKVLIPLGNQPLNYYGIILRQDGFTPRSIRHDSIYFGERPYASVFFVSHFLTSTNIEKQHRLTTNLSLGIIGPAAKGEEEQKAIHRALNNIQPLGWEYQVAQDFILNYNVQFEKGFIAKNKFELIGFTALRAGTLYDDITVGTMLRSGWMQSYFSNLGLTKQKNAMNNGNKFQCYGFAKTEVKLVGYNATLQGGMINKNSVYTIPAKNITRVVGVAYVGIVLAYKQVSLEYTKAFISPEFKGGLPHGWGHCTITICF